MLERGHGHAREARADARADAGADTRAEVSGVAKRPGVTRRSFVVGSAAATAATAVALNLSGCGDDGAKKVTGEPQVITDESKVVDVTDDYKNQDCTLQASASWDLPLGCVPFHCEGDWAALMQAPESARSVNTLGILSLASGTRTTLVDRPSQGSAFSFYDVRCSAQVFAWVEMSYATGDWVLLAQPLQNGALQGKPKKIDSGNADWEPARFAATGDSVIWQKMPLATGSKRSETSHCNRWRVGDKEPRTLCESVGRFATWPRISDGTLTIAPRVNNDEGVFYGITAYDLSSEKMVDQLVMPQNVSPFEAVYMGDSFAFSVEANYQSGGVLGKMGTFIGREGGPFVFLSREPLACVMGKGSTYLIKAQSSHFVVDTKAETYSVLVAPDKALGYGDYPASEGLTDRAVTYATVRGDNGLPAAVRVRAFGL